MGCECINSEKFDFNNLEKQKCAHSTMINDQVLIGFIANLISLEPKFKSLAEYSTSVLNALKQHNHTNNYEQFCNKRLNNK